MGQAPPHQACLRGGIPARGLQKHRSEGWATTHPCHLAPALTWTAGNSPQGGGGALGALEGPAPASLHPLPGLAWLPAPLLPDTPTSTPLLSAVPYEGHQACGSCQHCRLPRGPQAPRASQPSLWELERPALGSAGRGQPLPTPTCPLSFRAASPYAHMPCRHQGAITAPSVVSGSQAGAGNRLLAPSKLRDGASGTWGPGGPDLPCLPPSQAPPSSLSGPALISRGLAPLLSPPGLSHLPAHSLQEALQDQSSLPGPQSHRSGRPWGPQGSPEKRP